MSRSARINGPSDASVGSDQYQQDCLFALEPSVVKLIELAADAGWDEQQAVCAIMCIAALQVRDKTLFQSDLMAPPLLDDTDIAFPGSFRFRDITSLDLSRQSDGRTTAVPQNASADSDDEEIRDP